MEWRALDALRERTLERFAFIETIPLQLAFRKSFEDFQLSDELRKIEIIIFALPVDIKNSL